MSFTLMFVYSYLKDAQLSIILLSYNPSYDWKDFLCVFEDDQHEELY